MSAQRKLQRRSHRSESALDLRVELMTGRRSSSPHKVAKKRTRNYLKYQAAARFIVGLLIRATGTAAPPLCAPPTSRLDVYHQRIAEQGV